MLLRERDEAEDVLQSTFRAGRTGRFLRGGVPRDEGAWLATIARNECREGSGSGWTLLAPRPCGSSPRTRRRADERIADPRVGQALAALSKTQREAVVLHDVLGLRAREVGDAGLSRPAVEALLFRARRQLRLRLRPGRALVVPAAVGQALAQAIPGFVAAAVSRVRRQIVGGVRRGNRRQARGGADHGEGLRRRRRCRHGGLRGRCRGRAGAVRAAAGPAAEKRAGGVETAPSTSHASCRRPWRATPAPAAPGAMCPTIARAEETEEATKSSGRGSDREVRRRALAELELADGGPCSSTGGGSGSSTAGGAGASSSGSGSSGSTSEGGARGARRPVRLREQRLGQSRRRRRGARGLQLRPRLSVHPALGGRPLDDRTMTP